MSGPSIRRRWFVAAAATAVVTPIVAIGIAHAATVTNLFVSPSGSDSNAGTSASAPLKTLAHARDVVRGIDQSTSGEIRVNLAAGTYRLSSPLVLDARDSGTDGHDVVWQAASGAQPVVSGGVQVTGWKKGSGNVWSAPAPAALTDTRQLYVNGKRAVRATGNLPIALKQTSTGYTTATTNPMDNWRNPTSIEFVYRGGLGLWTAPRCPVASISPTVVKMAQPSWNNSTQRVIRTDGSGRHFNLVGRKSITEQPTAVENAFELLDSPGEWYLDKSSHTVFYLPRSGENLATADVEAPVLEQLVEGRGTAS